MSEHETTEQFARRRMREKLIEELGKDCPVCSAMLYRTANACDGLPDGVVFEAAYNCGGRVFVKNDAELSVEQGCDRHLSDAVDSLWQDMDDDRQGLIAEIEEMEA